MALNPITFFLVAVGVMLAGCAEAPREGPPPTREEIRNAVTGAEERAGRNRQRPDEGTNSIER